MSDFVSKSPSSSNVIGVSGIRGTNPNHLSFGMSMSTWTPPRRRSMSVGVGLGVRSPVPQSVPAATSYSTPQPPRRNSNPTGSSSSGFYSYSPSDSCTQSMELKARRYSQPTTPSPAFTASNADYLIRQEKESYSSLSFLPEVQTYLHFMEDTGPTDSAEHHRSNSFHGRNSIGSGGQRRMRTRSQSRSPAVEGEEEETCFIESPKQPSSTSSHQHKNSEHYGQYLTAAKSASVDTAAQVHPPPAMTKRRMSLGNNISGGETSRINSRRSPTSAQNKTVPVNAAVPEAEREPDVTSQEDQKAEGREGGGDEIQNGPIFRRCFERRRSSNFRTSFI